MKTTVIVIFLLFMVALIYGSIAANDPIAIEKQSARDAIDYCDKQWHDELMPTDQRRFIRGACDKMRSDYTTKYGRAP